MTGERPTLVDPIDAQRDRLRGGEPNDAITLVEYGDYECPYSRGAYRSIQGIERELGERLCFVFRHFPLREIHPHAQLAAEAAEEAAAHDRFWAVHDLLFGHQRSLEKPDLRRYAADAGLDLTEFDAALADGRHQARIEEDLASGLRSGVEGTPTLFIDGVRYERSYMPDELASELRRSRPTGNP